MSRASREGGRSRSAAEERAAISFHLDTIDGQLNYALYLSMRRHRGAFGYLMNTLLKQYRDHERWVPSPEIIAQLQERLALLDDAPDVRSDVAAAAETKPASETKPATGRDLLLEM